MVASSVQLQELKSDEQARYRRVDEFSQIPVSSVNLSILFEFHPA